ncbi:cytochrome b5 [Violaceomyces palustris]|uniref:Cytochrome b5 n=1 Tax=Violaceomyces palustris TaxID=1673888 RepID=A0ACD0P678_9BASI|nr:cytochrome b5 [Violaceomyces palustris]
MTAASSTWTWSYLEERLELLGQGIVSNPLNLALLLVLIYVIVPVLLPKDPNGPTLLPPLSAARSHLTVPTSTSTYSYLPSKHPNTTVWTRYTPRTLAVFDGTNPPSGDANQEPTILLAINRKVFDVTKGKNFYGPGGPYGNFAGRDASRGMAKQSFDLEMLTPLDREIDTLEDLTPMEVSNMKEWEGHFTGKYGIVGELINESELATEGEEKEKAEK